MIKHSFLLVSLVLIAGAMQAQTEMDAIMMNRSQLCSGFAYSHSSWDTYWEGTLKRKNENLGTVTSQSAMFMTNYGITSRLNVIASASYVWTMASAGTLQGMKGLQDGAVFIKWLPYEKVTGHGKIRAVAIGGVTAPLTNYVIDFLPMSIGMGSTNFIGRAMVDYNYRRITFTGSAAYIRRSNIKLDRNAYYDTQLHLTNEVKMPDAAQYQFRTGYRGQFLLAEILLTNWTTLGGFDLTRNNMPFPSNRMNWTSIGFQGKYTLPRFTSLSVIAGAATVLGGRNTGMAHSFNVGAFYGFYMSKKKVEKNN